MGESTTPDAHVQVSHTPSEIAACSSARMIPCSKTIGTTERRESITDYISEVF